jgi:WD40 repeat protein
MPCHRGTLVALGILLSLTPPAIAQPMPLTDLYGDPLPDGAIGRLGTARLRHSAFVRATTFLPDGTTLASVDDHGMVCLWDLATGKERTHYRIKPASAAVTTFSPDGRLVACSNGHEFRLYDLATGKLLHEHGATPKNHVPADFEQAHSRPLLGFSGDSRTMATASADRTKVHLWEVSTGKALRTLDVNDLLDFTLSPDGKLLAASGFGGKLSGAVWDISTGKRLYGFPFFQPVFAPDGKTLAAVSANGKQLVLCDAVTGKQLHAFGFLGAFRCLAFAPDGKTLAALDGKGRAKVRLWDVNTYAAVSTHKADPVPERRSARLTVRRAGCRVGRPGRHRRGESVPRRLDVGAGPEASRPVPQRPAGRSHTQ